MKIIFQWQKALLIVLLSTSCSKTEFLDKKPSTNILIPTTLNDFQLILDNTIVFNSTGTLGQMASDEYELTYSSWESLPTATERNSYVWSKDIYEGDTNISDWNLLYKQIFYSNSVLDGLSKSNLEGTAQGGYLKGWALFNRAYAFYDLTRNFCVAYDVKTASTDLGIPLRLSSAIDYTLPRATLQQTFDKIVNDLINALNFLPSDRPKTNLNRPSKIAVYALLARIYLDMRLYDKAESYANQCMSLYKTLIDYNSVNKTAITPFSTTNDELIYNTSVASRFILCNTSSSSPSTIPLHIIDLYEKEDLRLPIFFSKKADGTYYRKRGYQGAGNTPFTGLATDEIYLIKAECLARRGEILESMNILNQLLVMRFSNTTQYIPLTATSITDAINKVLIERMKELSWRGIRWQDLKRLNKQGENVILKRTLGIKTITLPPNDARYIFPIPNEEIMLTGIKQNDR